MKTLQNIEQATPDARILAFLSLQKSGRSVAGAIPLLLSIVARGEEYSAGAAINTLGFIGPGADLRVTQTLLQILERGLIRDNQTFLSKTAQSALSKAAPSDAAGVPALVNALKNSQPLVRFAATGALANIGAASAPAAATLSAALRAADKHTSDEEWKQFIRLAIAIGKDEDGLIDAIFAALDSPQIFGRAEIYDEDIRANLWIALADILAKSGDKLELAKRRAIAARVLHTLQTAIQSERPQIFLFIGATRAAGALGGEAKDAVPILMEAIQSDKWPGFPVFESDGMIFHGYVATTSVRLEAIEALARIGKPAAPALPVLQTIVETKQEENFWGESPPSSSDAAREAIKAIKAINAAS